MASVADEYAGHVEGVDPFNGVGELETARLMSEGNVRAELLCEMASAIGACAVDVATARDDDEAQEGVLRALATLEHLRALLDP